jgi:hypothetical protein
MFIWRNKMKIKMVAISICMLFFVATALPVTGNIASIDKPKISTLGVLQDLNLDLAITNAFSNDVEIFVGDGSGGFTSSENIMVGNFPAGITDGDFNMDGVLDLATADYVDSTVTVLLGNGTGEFSSSGNFSVGTEPLGIINEDFNSDEILDIAVANSGSNFISVLLGNGTGEFAGQQTYQVGNGPVDLCTGMFDSDDNYDIVSVNLDGNSVGILTGDGAGGFTLTNTINLEADYKPYAITKGDFDKDGNMDVAIASGGFPYVGVLLGNGTGEFSSIKNYIVGYGLERFDIVTDDFNNDGELDIAVPNTDNDTISVLLGNGTGGFDPHQTYNVGAYPVGICNADLNTDGNSDLVITNAFDNTISILLGAGGGVFQSQQVISAGDGPVGVICGNIDYIPEPVLECDGEIRWTRITPGSDIIDEFSIGNTGEPGSVLQWEIESYPSWGTWDFSEDSGFIMDGVWDPIQVFITAPEESQTEFTGTIKIINSNNPSESCTIDVTIETPRSNSLFQTLFERLLERFPNIFPIMRWFFEL